ncbi:uncharacterized protein LOC119681717 [Teleopsis dalmanni]|uniref:uncharacterized protein LOC119681717 n=1 Tax=Teleopsis dalmanni TaxID=139649 RepID=UPI0018CFBDA2|nr:uncharacterized protein LOC119681717 [Teleopsis dalmanni]
MVDDSQVSSKDLINLSEYCDFNKFFLVEEIALEPDYTQLHYGKCLVIGKLRRNVEGDFELENIHLPNLPNEYSLPEGFLSVHLLTFSYLGIELEDGHFCEIYAELVLLNLENRDANKSQLTVRGLQEILCHTEESQKQKKITEYTKSHKPALRVYDVKKIDRAGELAERNLRIRMIAQL